MLEAIVHTSFTDHFNKQDTDRLHYRDHKISKSITKKNQTTITITIMTKIYNFFNVIQISI